MKNRCVMADLDLCSLNLSNVIWRNSTEIDEINSISWLIRDVFINEYQLYIDIVHMTI